MKGTMLVFGLAMMLSGCAVTKDWSATGGSRADGVVRLSYELGELETVQLNESQAVRLAAQRCKTWGYSGAEAFGGTTRQCNKLGGFSGCAQWMVTKEFQCTGTGDDAPRTGRSPTAAPFPMQKDVAEGSVLPDDKEAANAQLALANAGCHATRLPFKFKQQHNTNYYEARCSDGRLVHTVCTFGDCRLRTRDD